MNESIQKWLERNRPPRVKITYDVETGNAIEKRELPFVVGILADLSGDRLDDDFPDYGTRVMEEIDRDNFNDVMTKARPSVRLDQVPRTLPTSDPGETTLGGSITFRSLADFDPVAVVQAVPDLAALYRLRANVRMLQSRAESSSSLARALEPLMAIGNDGNAARAPLQVLDDPTARTALPTSRETVRKLAVAIAKAATPEDKAASATVFGFKATTPPTALVDTVRKFIGLYAHIDTADHRRAAQDLLRALATLKAGAPAPDADTLKARTEAMKKLGYTDSSHDADVGGAASDLLALLATPPGDSATDDQVAHYGDAQRAALVFLGTLQPEDSTKVDNPDPVSGAEERHFADSRWFSNNMLLAATPVPGPTADQATLTKVQSVLGLLDAAGLKSDNERQAFVAPLGYFRSGVLKPLESPAAAARKPMGTETSIDLLVAQIDAMISKQLRGIMHAPTFQAVEATWRGLFYLVSRAETGKALKLRILNATQQELLDDLEKAVDKDQSRLFKMIYEAGYGTLGGEPYSMLLGGYEVGRSAQEIEFLSKMAEVAAAAHAPFISAASPSIFGLHSFADLARPRDLEKIFEGVELVGFQSLRETEDSRYVTLVLPHVLLRLPYGEKSWPVQGLAFEEQSDHNQPGDFLWGSAAWLLAERITHAYSLYGWTAAIRGVEGGGLIEGLPLYTYPVYDTGSDAQALFCPTEVSITDRREKELSDLGFIALCHCMGTGTAAFFGGQTLNQPKSYVSDAANANARLSAQLPYMLAASRFAHYIKVMMRDKVGSFLTRKNIETFLNTWISQYVLLDENAPQDAKASYPLSQAEVVVIDVPGEPGAYQAVVFLRPHFQLEELTTSIRLVASLPAG